MLNWADSERQVPGMCAIACTRVFVCLCACVRACVGTDETGRSRARKLQMSKRTRENADTVPPVGPCSADCTRPRRSRSARAAGCLTASQCPRRAHRSSRPARARAHIRTYARARARTRTHARMHARTHARTHKGTLRLTQTHTRARACTMARTHAREQINVYVHTCPPIPDKTMAHGWARYVVPRITVPCQTTMSHLPLDERCHVHRERCDERV